MADFQYANPTLRPSEVAEVRSQKQVGRRIKKRWIILLVGLLCILAAPAMLGYMYAQAVYSPSVPSGSTVQFTVNAGESVDEVVGRLHDQGLVEQPLFFKLYMRFSGGQQAIQAGNFAIPSSISIADLVERLGVAEREQVVMQFVEGLRREEMAEYVESRYQAGDITFTGEEFSQLALNPPAEIRQMLGSRLPAGASLQGFLFPETYHIDRDATALDMIKTMVGTYLDKVTSDVQAGFAAEGLTEREALILAAIVEREAFADEERPVIAEILLKRLRTGEILGTDATIQYALGYSEEEGTWWRKLITLDDLAMDSPYNSRLNTGLPPAPIANPGIGAITAVAFPSDTPYMYYLHDANGTIHYAASLDEHNANVAQYIQ